MEKILVQLDNPAWPSESEEIWRYSRIAAIKVGDYKRLKPADVSVTGADFASAASDVRLIPAERDFFSTLVAASATPKQLIFNQKGTATTAVVTQDLQPADEGALVVSRLVIAVEAGCEATVIHRIGGADVSALVVPEVELRLAEAARLRYIVVQELGRKAALIATVASDTGRDAHLSTLAVSLGAHYGRVRFDAGLGERGAHNDLFAVYFAERNQLHDFRTVQHHIAARTTSELVFKGAVGAGGRSVYSGLIKIGENAKGSVANQTNRNLLLAADASAESVPNLEIENNDVKCSHASAIGPISEDERYYLQSRGVPEDLADRLIVVGFFKEVLATIPDPDLRSRLVAAVSASVDAAFAQNSAVGVGTAARPAGLVGGGC